MRKSCFAGLSCWRRGNFRISLVSGIIPPENQDSESLLTHSLVVFVIFFNTSQPQEEGASRRLATSNQLRTCTHASCPASLAHLHSNLLAQALCQGRQSPYFSFFNMFFSLLANSANISARQGMRRQSMCTEPSHLIDCASSLTFV